MARTIELCADVNELAERGAERIAAAANEAVAARGCFTLCLSGGDTPAGAYARLAEAEVPWHGVHVFWGDERCIPLERPDSHYTMASRLLLSRVPIPPENVHRARGDAPNPTAAAVEYEHGLRAFFGSERPPAFDLLLLGMGEDGHVASVFPGSDGWAERERWVVEHFVIKRGERARRITLTLPVLTAAREVMFIVSGRLKADMLAAVLEGEVEVPAAEVDSAASTVRWMVDREAASCLRQNQAMTRSGPR